MGAFEDEDADIYTHEDISEYDFALEESASSTSTKNGPPPIYPLVYRDRFSGSERGVRARVVATETTSLLPATESADGFRPET